MTGIDALDDADALVHNRGRTRERIFSNYHWSGSPSKTISDHFSNEPVSTIILNALTPEQIEVYTILIRLDEVANVFRNGNFVPEDERCRSPSPAPIYDASGKRKNTRDVRYKKKYENERMWLIERLLKLVPDFKPPDWYKPKPVSITDKLYIKTAEYPDINFIGLLIGPRGNTLKKLQQDSGAKIGIRGKGSVKEGRHIMNISPELNNLQEQLHCLITADSLEKVELAKKLCQQVMDKAIFSPMGQNDLKRDQLRELAKLNGTFRDDTTRPCPICGELGHNRNTCSMNKSNKLNFTASLKCNKCGNFGHLEKDCKVDLKTNNISQKNDEMDKEFEDFMNELNSDNEDTQKNQTKPKSEHSLPSIPVSKVLPPPSSTITEVRSTSIKRAYPGTTTTSSSSLSSSPPSSSEYKRQHYNQPFTNQLSHYNQYGQQYSGYGQQYQQYGGYGSYGQYTDYNSYDQQYYNRQGAVQNNGYYDGYSRYQQSGNNIGNNTYSSYKKPPNPFQKQGSIPARPHMHESNVTPVEPHIINRASSKFPLPPPPPGPPIGNPIKSNASTSTLGKHPIRPPPPPPPPPSATQKKS
jgi:splicing factor 1